MSELPKGWAEVTVGDLANDVSSGFASGRHNSDSVGIPHLRPMNVSRNGEIDLGEVKYVAPEAGDRRLAFGDVLFNNTNSPVLVGKTAAYLSHEEVAFSNHMTRVRLHQGVSPSFVARQLHHIWATGGLSRLISNHVNQASIAGSRLASDVRLRVAPVAEQQRIVAAIDEAFSKLDAGEAALRTVRQLLKRMREAVLAAAVTGHLVPQDPFDAPASGWREWASAKDDPFAINVLPGLPESWRWVRAASACDAVECGGTPAASHMTQGIGDVPFVKVYNLTMNGALDFSVNPTFIDSATHARQSRSAARPGDVLTNIVGPPLGKVAVVPHTFPSWNMNQAVVMFRPGAILQSDFLAIALQTPSVLGRLAATSRATAGQFNVSLTACRYLPIPVPPKAEQHRIVAEVHRQLSVIVQCERAVELGVARSAGLRRSVLKAAFEGQLVSQDSSDEPASVLLERIRAERAASYGSSGGRRRKRLEAS